jgi:uncharacterized integral membrane protein
MLIDASKCISYRLAKLDFMNAKLLLKTIFLIIVLLLLVMMGMNNRNSVPFALPPLVKAIQLPAAYMYVGFFGIGLLTGTVLTAGGGKKGGSSSSSKSREK